MKDSEMPCSKVSLSETWKINKKDDAKLDTFLFKCLRRILKIRWPYIVSNNDILKKTGEKRISESYEQFMNKTVHMIFKFGKIEI